MNFIKDYQLEKEKIKNIIDQLYSKKILNEEEYKEIVDELHNDIIKLAVIGQMKYGKSTFINSFIFHSNYLPTSSTPMTAALSEIKYADNEKYEVHFFSEEEFNELKNKDEFKDILQKANHIPNKYSLFGSTKIISRDEFENYVGADGLYTPIVKMLTIYNPNEILKETIVVDTPGFNDPIESREKIAEGFIKNADFVILFLYAGKPFDSTDREIIIDKLQYLGKAGKVLIVVNKADSLIEEYGTMEAVTDFIKDTLNNTIDEYIFSESLANTLREAEIVPISSLMALLGRMDEQELKNDKNLLEYLEMFKNDFGIRDRKELEEISNIKSLEKIIKKSLKEDKLKIIINGIKTRIMGNISKKIQHMQNQIQQIKLNYKINSLTELEDYKQKLEKFKYSDYKNEILSILGEIQREINFKIDSELTDIKFWLDQNKDDIKRVLLNSNESKDEIKNKFSDLMIQFNNEFKGKIKEFIKNFILNYQSTIRKTIDEIFSDLRNSEFAKEFELDNEVLEKIKENLFKISAYELTKGVDNLQIDTPKVDTSIWFLGDSKEEIKDKFSKYINNQYFNNAKNLLNDYRIQTFEYVNKAFNKKEEKGVIIREFNSAVIGPIDKALKEKENELKGFKSKIEEEKNKLQILEQKLKTLNEGREFVERELK